LRECRRRDPPIKWLFLLDDDELLYLNVPLSFIVDTAPEDTACLHFENLEAAPVAVECSNVFEEVREFVDCGRLSYANGKSAGHTERSGWVGCHFFRGPVYEVPRAHAVVLHFESCTYAIWLAKFRRQRRMPAEVLAEVPFPFYRDSVALFRRPGPGLGGCRDDDAGWRLYGGAVASAGEEAKEIEEEEARARDFYIARKLGHYKMLPRPKLRYEPSVPARRMI